MTPSPAGFSGSLLPLGYLFSALADDAESLGCPPLPPQIGRSLDHAWSRAAGVCGPSSGLRKLFDFVVEPLFQPLGFRVRSPVFGPADAHARLDTPLGRAVSLIILPWTTRPSTAWRDLARDARSHGASWGFVLAPPFLSIVRVVGHSVRHSLDVALPAVVKPPSVDIFWMLARAAAFEPVSASGEPAFLDALLSRAARYQDGVRADLQLGVADALSALTTTAHGNTRRPPRDQALTLVYRILFLLFAESRGLVPSSNPIYDDAYSVTALCGDAIQGELRGCWDALGAITRLARRGCRSTSLTAAPFNGQLFARAAAPVLERRRSARRPIAERAHDVALGRALVALASRRSRRGRETISYRDLGVEQLGAVYERLLDTNDAADAGARLTRRRTHGRDHSSVRKQTGTFYTPQPLAEFIVRRTLAPLVEHTTSNAILDLRVVDPSMGSGACLVAACRYLAAAYERALVSEGRASPGDFDDGERANTRRLIAERCLAGVDRNPMAVELARLSIWLTTLARDKPLGFLDHRLRVGDSLVGAWPEDLMRLPANGRRRPTELPLFESSDLGHALTSVARSLRELRLRRDESVDDVHAKAAAWKRFTSRTSPVEPWRQAADLWCARWFWPGSRRAGPDAAETRALFDAVLSGDRTLPARHVEARQSTWSRVSSAVQCFHWPLEFPDVYFDENGQPRSTPGFDAVIGNPPWEMIRRDEGDAHPAARALLEYVRESGQYPSCNRGHLNLYQAFLDRALAIVRRGGRVGVVVPWSLASDDGAAPLRARLLDEGGLDTIVGLDNARGLFPIHRGLRFAVVAGTAGRRATEIRARFGVTTTGEIDALPGRDDALESAYPTRLTPDTIRIAGGSLGRIPDARRPGDVEWLVRLSERFPALGGRDGWRVSFGRELNATEARPLFGTGGLPVIEGKDIVPFRVLTRRDIRIERHMAMRLLPRAPFDHPRLAYRDVSGVANTQSLIAAIVPSGTVTTHTLFCLNTPIAHDQQWFLCALFNSFVLNSVVRLLMGGHLTTTLVEGLPVPTWKGDRFDCELAALAAHLGSRPVDATPTLAALNARAARLYGLSKTDLGRVLESFPLVPEALKHECLAHFHEG